MELGLRETKELGDVLSPGGIEGGSGGVIKVGMLEGGLAGGVEASGGGVEASGGGGGGGVVPKGVSGDTKPLGGVDMMVGGS